MALARPRRSLCGLSSGTARHGRRIGRAVLHLRAHPQLLAAVVIGVLAAWLSPGLPRTTERIIVGWNVGAWLYLVLIGLMMLRADQTRIKRVAASHAEGATIVLSIVAAASVATLVALALELAAAKARGLAGAWPYMLLASSTLACSWLLLPVIFSLNYASQYYRHSPPGGLVFPTDEARFEPDYTDFLYLSFAIAVAFQTSDVNITSRPMRRLVLAQGVLAFFFNSAILALIINAAADLF
jgi:uncharacterized membrane protein